MTSRIALLLFALLASVFLVVAAACGTSSEDDASDSDTTSSSETSMDDDMDDMDDMPTHSVSGGSHRSKCHLWRCVAYRNHVRGAHVQQLGGGSRERADVWPSRRQYARLQAGLG